MRPPRKVRQIGSHRRKQQVWYWRIVVLTHEAGAFVLVIAS
jgi:hypothetical protein